MNDRAIPSTAAQHPSSVAQLDHQAASGQGWSVPGPLSEPSVVYVRQAPKDDPKPPYSQWSTLVPSYVFQSHVSPWDQTMAAVETYRPIYLGGDSGSEKAGVAWGGLVAAIDSEVTIMVGPNASPESLNRAFNALIDRAEGDPVAEKLIAAAAHQAFDERRTGEVFSRPGESAHPSKIDLDRARSPHEATAIAKRLLDEAKKNLDLAKSRLEAAREKFPDSVEHRERAVAHAVREAETADRDYRTALANEAPEQNMWPPGFL